MTRPQSPIQITALGIIALPHSQERHARQHHEPARALEKSIEPGRTHPIPPAFSPTEFLRRLRSAETLISFIDPGVDPNQVHPRRPRERKLARYRLGASALAGLPRTEVHPSGWRLRDLEDIGAPLGSCESRKHVDGARRYQNHPQLRRQEFRVHGMTITQSG